MLTAAKNSQTDNFGEIFQAKVYLECIYMVMYMNVYGNVMFLNPIHIVLISEF